MKSKYKILAVEWRSGLHTIGFVAYAIGFEDQWNSVVGAVPTSIAGLIPFTPDEEFSSQLIAADGAKIEWNVAREIFPKLDITKHKYYPKNLK